MPIVDIQARALIISFGLELIAERNQERTETKRKCKCKCKIKCSAWTELL